MRWERSWIAVPSARLPGRQNSRGARPSLTGVDAHLRGHDGGEWGRAQVARTAVEVGGGWRCRATARPWRGSTCGTTKPNVIAAKAAIHARCGHDKPLLDRSPLLMRSRPSESERRDLSPPLVAHTEPCMRRRGRITDSRAFGTASGKASGGTCSPWHLRQDP